MKEIHSNLHSVHFDISCIDRDWSRALPEYKSEAFIAIQKYSIAMAVCDKLLFAVW